MSTKQAIDLKLSLALIMQEVSGSRHSARAASLTGSVFRWPRRQRGVEGAFLSTGERAVK